MASARRQQASGRRRGAAMIEFVLVLPFLIILLMLTVFFGHSMARKQQVVVADRHYAWRHAKKLPDPADFGGFIDYSLITEKSFNGEPVTLSMARGSDTPRDGQDGLVDAARGEGAAAGDYADVLLGRGAPGDADYIPGHFPGDVSYHVEATYPRDTLPMDRFGREIGDRYFREGVPWQRDDVSIWEQLRDQFIEDFDKDVIGDNTAGLLGKVQNLYLRHW